MNAAFVRRLNRPGADGRAYRSFILDWLYLERPLIDRFRGARYQVQFEGPAITIDGQDYPLGAYIQAPPSTSLASPTLNSTHTHASKPNSMTSCFSSAMKSPRYWISTPFASAT